MAETEILLALMAHQGVLEEVLGDLVILEDLETRHLHLHRKVIMEAIYLREVMMAAVAEEHLQLVAME